MTSSWALGDISIFFVVERGFAGVSLPETQLAVAGGVGVPRGRRGEQLGEPRSAQDEGSERDRHLG